MVRWKRSLDKESHTAARLWTIYAPAVYRYVVCRVNDAGAAETITLNIIKKVKNHQICHDSEKRVMITFFTEARKQVGEYIRTSPDRRFPECLSEEEAEVISLRIGAKLPARIIGKLMGQPEAAVKKIVYQSAVKLCRSGKVVTQGGHPDCANEP